MMRNKARLERLESIVFDQGIALCLSFIERVREILSASERFMIADHIKEIADFSKMLMQTGNSKIDQVLQKVKDDSEASELWSKIQAIFGLYDVK